ncbi:MAG: VWA domain-containing protein [Myxococcales bacterium]|nr:VWA domain-containing protein [Myxococcales bacterium]
MDLSGTIGPELFRLARRAAGCLLAEAYLERDEVGLVAFRDVAATVVFAPTSSVELARARLGALPTGGKTPLAAGLAAGWQMLRNARRRARRARPVLVVISDGQGNVASRPGHAAVLSESARVAAALRALPGLRTVLFDATEDGKNDAAAVRLAEALGAPTLKVHALAELDDQRLREVLRHV